MDEMAKMLETYAGGLQQSFESVFERVGQSLEQSAQVMQMMNGVMESALLQNLRINFRYDGRTTELCIEVENQSQIMLGPTKISAQLNQADQPFFSRTVEAIRAEGRVLLQAPVRDVAVPLAGFIELEFTSPGTQQPLTKRSPFRILYFQQGRFQALQRGEEGGSPGPSEVAVTSDRFRLTRVRELLDLSPIDGILTDDQGRYRFMPKLSPNNGAVFYLSVSQGEMGGPAFPVTVSAAGSAESSDERRRQCQEIINEMEIDTDAEDSELLSE